MTSQIRKTILAAPLFLAAQLASALAQGTAFTYQGRLDTGGAAYAGLAQFQFTLWNDVTNGTQVAASIPPTIEMGVTNGLFTTPIDFGAAAFDGSPRFVQVAIRTNLGAFTTLTPRQQVTAAPYAILAGNISGTVPGQSLSGNYSNAVSFGNAANTFNGAFSGNGAGMTNLNASQLTTGTVPSGALGNAWKLAGNTGITAGTHFLGTTDNRALELRVNGARGLLLSPAPSNSVNVLGGYAGNHIVPGTIGATLSGGGALNYMGFSIFGTNVVMGDFGTIAGGVANTVSNIGATVSGGFVNTAKGDGATISGGNQNTALGSRTTIAGGELNEALALGATVGGGYGHTASNLHSTVAGGSANTAGGENSTVGGGAFNFALTMGATVGGGQENFASNLVATVPGGSQNVAGGEYSFAAGRRARANHSGTFVWADSQSTNFPSTAINQVSFRCAGGVRFTSGTNAVNQTVSWTPGSASWSFTSDRNTKENLQPVAAAEVLERVSRLPLLEWNYIGYAQRHVGPMAQDFHEAFPWSGDERTLNSADLDGVALAAIQGLNQKLTEELKRRDAENAELRQRLVQLERLVVSLVRKAD